MKKIGLDVELGENVVIRDFVNLYGCRIGDNSTIGPFVEIQRGAVVGANCKISSHSFICEGVRLGTGVFIGHGVMFTNDRNPRATGPDGALLEPGEWTLEITEVEDEASIGSGSVILPGITIGTRAVIGAGSVVTKNVAAGATVFGNPARPAERAT